MSGGDVYDYDVLTGGAGRDTFVVASGYDTITDFGNGADVLQISAGAGASVTLGEAWTAVAADVHIDGGVNIYAAGYAVDVSAITAGVGGFNIVNNGVAAHAHGVEFERHAQRWVGQRHVAWWFG